MWDYADVNLLIGEYVFKIRYEYRIRHTNIDYIIK